MPTPKEMPKPDRPAHHAILRYRRKNFLVARGFQYRVIGRFTLLVIGSIILSHALSLGYLKLQEWTNPSSQTLLYFAGSINETLTFSRSLDLLWAPLLISMSLGILLVSLWGIFYSHRMAGPLFNLKRKLAQLGEGSLPRNMQIRKTDEFHDLEESFNQMVAHLQGRLHQLETDVLRTAKTNKPKIVLLFKKFYGDNQTQPTE